MAPIKGINVPGTLVPFTDQDTYPVTDPVYGIGGWREVADTATRDAIPAARLRVGMVVSVQGDKPYMYNGSGWDPLISSDVDALAGLSDVTLTSPSLNQILQYNGSAWVNATVPPTTPGGADTQIQFNNAGVFGGSSNLTWDNVNNLFKIFGVTKRPDRAITINITTLPDDGFSDFTLTADQNNLYNFYEITSLTVDSGLIFEDGQRGPFVVYNHSNFALSLFTVSGGSNQTFDTGVLPAGYTGTFYIDSSNNVGIVGVPVSSNSPTTPYVDVPIIASNQGFPFLTSITVSDDGMGGTLLKTANLQVSSFLEPPFVIAKGATSASGAPVLKIPTVNNSATSPSTYYAIEGGLAHGGSNISQGAFFSLFGTNAWNDAATESSQTIGFPAGAGTIDNFAGFKVIKTNFQGAFPSTNFTSFHAAFADSAATLPGNWDFYGDGSSHFASISLDGSNVQTSANGISAGINLFDTTAGGFTCTLNGAPGGHENGALYFVKNVGTANTLQVSSTVNIDNALDLFLGPGQAAFLTWDEAAGKYHILGSGDSGATTLATEVQVNGVDTTSQTPIDFISSSTITASNPSGGQVRFDLAVPGSNKQIFYNNSGAFAGSSDFTWDNSASPKKLTLNGVIASSISVDAASVLNFGPTLDIHWSQVNATGVANPTITGPLYNISYGGTANPTANAAISGGGMFVSSQDTQTDSILGVLGWQILAAAGENSADHGSITGLQVLTQPHSSGTTTTVEGLYTQLRFIRPSTIGTCAAIHLDSPMMAGGSGVCAITTYAQLLIESPTVGTISTTDQFAIKVNGGVVDLGPGNVRIASANVPANSSSTGVTGTITWDSGFLYVCVGTNSWKRAALSTF